MFAQRKKTRLTDGSFVWSVIIGYDGITAVELDAYSERHANDLFDAIKADTAIDCLTSIQGE